MASRTFSIFTWILILASALLFTDAFAPVLPRAQLSAVAPFSTTQRAVFQDPSSITVSAGTLDPTTFLSDILGGFLSSPAILAVPIVAALGVAGLLAFLIVSYANPEVEDDE